MVNKYIFILFVAITTGSFQYSASMWLWETPKFLREKFEKLLTFKPQKEFSLPHRWRWDPQVNPALRLNNSENMIVLGVTLANNTLSGKSKIILDQHEKEQCIGDGIFPSEIVMMILLQTATGNKLFDSMTSLTNFARSCRAHYRCVIDVCTMSNLLKQLLASLQNNTLPDLQKTMRDQKSKATTTLLPEFQFLIKKLLIFIEERPRDNGSQEKKLRGLNNSWQQSLKLLLQNGLDINHVISYENEKAETFLSKTLICSNIDSVIYLLNKGVNGKNDLQCHHIFFVPGYNLGDDMYRSEFYADAIKQLVNAGLSPNSCVTGPYGFYKGFNDPFLVFAIATNHLDLARFLIEKGATIDEEYTAESGGERITMTPREFAQKQAVDDPDKQAFVELFNKNLSEN